MRTVYLLLSIFLIILSFGCSRSSNPTIPKENLSPGSIAEATQEGIALLGAGTMNLDTGELIPSRDLSSYLNVTPYIGSNFSYEIVEFIRPCYLNVEFSITNPTTVTVWDVCLVFEDLHGKSLMYNDSYVDIYRQYDPDPAISFWTDDEFCTFPPGSTFTTNGMIKYPAGASSLVDYFIIAHFGGNTGGVKFLGGNVWDSDLMPDGGSATLSAYLYDYQNDVQMIVADTTPITGGYTFLHPTAYPDEWSAEITNSQGAPSGTYSCWMMAKSPSVPQYNTYTKVDITVSHYPTTIYVDDDNVNGPWDGSMSHPFRYIGDAVEYAVSGDVIHVKPGVYYEGEQNDPFDRPGMRISALNNLTIQGEGLPRIIPTLNDNSTDNSVFSISECNNLVIDGFEITPQQQFPTAISISSSSNAEIKNCVVTPSYAPGFLGFIYANDCPGLLIENNTLDGMVIQVGAYSGNQLITLYSCPNAVITLNSIRNLTFGPIPADINMSYIIVICNYSDNTTISKNVIGDFNWDTAGTQLSHVLVIAINDCISSIIRNNLINNIHFTNTDFGARILGMDIWMSNGASIYNNTIDSLVTTTNGYAASVGLNFDGEGMTYNFHSNIVTRSLAADAWSYGVASPFTVTQTYSDVWSITTARYYWNAQEGVGGLDVDPQFVDYLNGDYHLDPLSQCVGAGLDGVDMGCYGGADPLP